MVRFYSTVAGSLAITVLDFHAPRFTSTSSSLKAAEKLTQHPHVAGTKNTPPGKMGQLTTVRIKHI